MTPHLHPRSRLTTSLFGTTLLVSFLVVGMPHIIPCPAPRIKYTEGDYEITEDGRRRRRRRSEDIKEPGLDGPGEDQFPLRSGEDEENLTQKTAHECPVPKPKGLIGQVLGFKKDAVDDKIPRPRVETGAKTKSRRGDS